LKISGLQNLLSDIAMKDISPAHSWSVTIQFHCCPPTSSVTGCQRMQDLLGQPLEDVLWQRVSAAGEERPQVQQTQFEHKTDACTLRSEHPAMVAE
jgi:hypothetical protein